jgi:hypothetical protein
MRADGTGNLTYRDIRDRQREAGSVSAQLVVPHGEFQPKRRGLCMQAMRSAYGQGALVFDSTMTDDVDHVLEVRLDQVAGVSRLDRQPGVHDIR